MEQYRTSTTGGTHIPVTGGTSGVPATTTTTGGRRASTEQKGEESLERAGEQIVKTGQKLYHDACDACHNWRHYPKLLTTVALLSMFLIGASTMGLVSKTGIMGKGGNYVSAHWDRQTADAHHALDIILDHLKHPELYEDTQHGYGVVKEARSTIGDFVKGILPSSWGGRKGMMGKGYMDEVVGGRGGRGRGGGVSGGMFGGQDLGDYASEKMSDLSYAARHAGEQLKDTGYGITNKMSDLASGLKSKFVGGDSDYYGMKEGMKQAVGGGGGRGGYGSRYSGYPDEEDDISAAKEKMRRVVRQAERDL